MLGVFKYKIMCDTPYYVDSNKLRYNKGEFTKKIPVACGRCYLCQKRRVDSWVYRLMQEDLDSYTSAFVTLTYNTENLPRTKNNYRTLVVSDVQQYIKNLRKLEDKYHKRISKKLDRIGRKRLDKRPIKYFAVGEYGSKGGRPHYHLIIFNVTNKKHYYEAWNTTKKSRGSVHIGDVRSNSIAYTAKYIMKERGRRSKNNDSKKEFMICSKGLGNRFLRKKSVVNFYKNRLDVQYLISNGYKIGIPKYYKEKMYTEEEKEIISEYNDENARKREKELKRKWRESNTNMEYDDWIKSHRAQRRKIRKKNQQLRN